MVDQLVVDNIGAREAARPALSESPDEDRRSAELTRAKRVWNETLRELSAAQDGVLGLTVDATLAIGTREAGVIEQGGARTGSIPFEYRFSAFESSPATRSWMHGSSSA